MSSHVKTACISDIPYIAYQIALNCFNLLAHKFVALANFIASVMKIWKNGWRVHQKLTLQIIIIKLKWHNIFSDRESPATNDIYIASGPMDVI